MDSVAFKAGLSRSIFMSLYNQQRPLNKTWARQLAKAIECSVDDLFIQTKVQTPASVATPTNVVANGDLFLTMLSAEETAFVVELCERESAFLRQTGRNLLAETIEAITAKVKNGSVSSKTSEKSTAIPQQPEVGLVSGAPVKRPAAKPPVVRRLSSPWIIEDLADALSALRGGMSNEDIANVTNRPMTDITMTKNIFGWMWHRKYPVNPSKADVLEKLNSQPETAAWRQLLVGPVAV